METAKTWFSVSEAAEHIGVSARQMRQLVYDRKIPFHRMGKFLRFRVTDLDAYVAANRFEAEVGPLVPPPQQNVTRRSSRRSA